MSGSVNKVILVGNLGRDPEIRSLNNGGRVANLSVATGYRWRDRQTNEQRERTEWHRVVVFDERLLEVVEKYVRKGQMVYLEGELQTRKWSDQSGQERNTTEVVLQRFRSQLTMLGGRGEGGGFAGEAGAGDYDRGAPGGGGGDMGEASGPGADLDDDIPF